MIKRYFFNVLLTLDQTFHVIFMGGDPDISISSHLALAKRLHDRGYAKKKWFVDPFARFVDYIFDNPLFTIEKDHVKRSLEIHEDNHKAIWKWYKLKDRFKDQDIRTML